VLDVWARERVVVEFEAVLCGSTMDKPNIGVFINDSAVAHRAYAYLST
jgi:hypothetical protein